MFRCPYRCRRSRPGVGSGSRLNARNIDRIFVSSRHSLELSILLERQRSMENIALNDTGAAWLSFATAPCSRRLLADPFSIVPIQPRRVAIAGAGDRALPRKLT
jgi:hypothetical protein